MIEEEQAKRDEIALLFRLLVKCNSKYNLGVPPALFLRLEALLGLNDSAEDEDE